jgi:hypothetical protein
VFALFRNNGTQFENDELYNDVQAVYEQHYYTHYKSDSRPVRITKMKYDDFMKPAEVHRGFRFEI